MRAMTSRENALHALAVSGTHNRLEAIDLCRTELGRALITLPSERATVAAALSANGWDGIGRVALAVSDLDAAAKQDAGLLDCVAGR